MTLSGYEKKKMIEDDNKIKDSDHTPRSEEEWVTNYKTKISHDQSAKLAARFMFAMGYYHDRMRFHVMLHPLFYLAGFLTAYALF